MVVSGDLVIPKSGSVLQISKARSASVSAGQSKNVRFALAYLIFRLESSAPFSGGL